METMKGSNSTSKDKHGKSSQSLRNRVRRIIDQETADEQDEFKFIGLENVVGQASGSSSRNKNPPNCCLRILWFIVILTCVLTCIYQICDRIEYFYTYPTYISVKIEERYNISYPTVTVCSTPGTSRRTKMAIARRHGTRFCDYLDVDMVDYNLTRVKKTAESLWRSWFNSEGNVINVDKAINIRFDIPKVEMQPENFIKTPFGTCLQHKTLHSSVEYQGTMSALVYGMTDPDPCNLPQVIFGARGHYIDPSSSRLFPSGLLVALPIKQYEFRGLSAPANPCVSDDEYWDCIIPCFETLMAENIECKLPYMVNVTKPYCTSSPDARKAQTMSLKFMRKKYLEENCGCPKRCNTTTYIIRTETIAIFPPMIVIYFPTNLVEISEEQYAYDFDKLICDLGGSLGLFLGFCVLSLIDSIQLFAGILNSKLCRKRQRRVNPEATAPQQIEPYMEPQQEAANVQLANAPNAAES